MGRRSTPSLTVRLLEERRDELLGELRALAPELVQKLEQTLEALREQWPERGEYDGLDRAGVIRKYLLKVGRPAELRRLRRRWQPRRAASMEDRSGTAGREK